MANRKKLTETEYKMIRDDFEEKYGYEGADDVKKKAFDKKFDERYELKKPGETDEETEKGPKKVTQQEYDALRKGYEKRLHYDKRTDEEKDLIDKTFDATYQVDKKNGTAGDDDVTDPADKKDPVDKKNPGIERERGRFGREIDDDDER